MDTLPSYKTWLQSKNYNINTIRNYLSDVNEYLKFESLDLYLSSIEKDQNQARYVSSLNKYFEFCIDQHLLDKNPLKSLGKKPHQDIDFLMDQYKTYLIKKHKTSATIKNYLNDIKQFINFCES